MKTYKAVFRPDDNGWWFIDVPELPGCHSQARNIASGRDHIREAISMVTNADLDTFDLDIDYQLPRAQQAAVALAMGDVAELVGVSHQRVAQIMKRPA